VAARPVKCRKQGSNMKGTIMRKVLFRILPAVFLALAVTAHARNNAAWRWIRPFDPTWPEFWGHNT
jgi:hypothetical protein